ncbi:MAG: S9 family peptidase [bacterium]|nr:S9 family peptidase [bacterium]
MSHRYLTIDEQINLPSIVLPYVTQTALSHDGRCCAYVKRTAPPEVHHFVYVAFVYDTESGETTALTSGGKSSGGLRWSMDGHALYFISDQSGRRQVHRYDVAMGESTQITQVETGVSGYRVTSDGQYIYYTASVPPSPHRQQRQAAYGAFEFVDEEHAHNALFRLNVADGSSERLTHEPFFIGAFDLSPDGRTLALYAADGPGRPFRDAQRLYLLDTATGALRRVETDPISLLYPVLFSPDSRHLCYVVYPAGRFLAYNNTLEILDAETGARRTLDAKIDQDIEPVAWTTRGLLCTVWQRTNRVVILVRENEPIEFLVAAYPGVAAAPSMSANGRQVAYALTTELDTTEVYLLGKRITDESAALKGKRHSRKSLIHWRSHDGLEIEGVLTVPDDFNPKRRYALLVIAHGGPKGVIPPVRAYQDFYPVEQFIEKGFLVLEPNYRGSDGYGEAFRTANIGRWGLEDYADVISGVDHLIVQGCVDGDRVGVMGWSQGGHIAAFCATYGDRFKAASVGAGIAHHRTHYLMADNIVSGRLYFGGVTPWDDPVAYDRASALTYLDRARTPVLIQHGENDDRVPVVNAHELHRALRDKGVPVTFVLFRNTPHGPQDRRTIKAIQEQNLLWFGHHLLGEPLQGTAWKEATLSSD